MSLSLSLNLHEEVVGLTDLVEEAIEIVEIGLDLINGKVNEQASDLSCLLLTHHPTHVLIDVLTSHVLVVRVFNFDGGPELEPSSVVLMMDGVSTSEGALNATLHPLDHNLRGRSHLLLLRDHHGLLGLNWGNLLLLGTSRRGPTSILLLTSRTGMSPRTTITILLLLLSKLIVSERARHAALSEILTQQAENSLNELHGVGSLQDHGI